MPMSAGETADAELTLSSSAERRSMCAEGQQKHGGKRGIVEKPATESSLPTADDLGGTFLYLSNLCEAIVENHSNDAEEPMLEVCEQMRNFIAKNQTTLARLSKAGGKGTPLPSKWTVGEPDNSDSSGSYPVEKVQDCDNAQVDQPAPGKNDASGMQEHQSRDLPVHFVWSSGAAGKNERRERLASGCRKTSVFIPFCRASISKKRGPQNVLKAVTQDVQLPVKCGKQPDTELHGILRICRSNESVMILHRGKYFSPAGFEALTDQNLQRKWVQTIRVIPPGKNSYTTMKAWLTGNRHIRFTVDVNM